LDEHLVVIGGRRDRLHVLNPVARLIHEARRAGTPPEDIAQILSNRYGIPHSAALRDVTAVLEQRRDLGIEPEGAAGSDPEVPQPVTKSPSAPEPACRADYRIADQPFTIRYGSKALYETVHVLLAHLGSETQDGKRKVIDAWGENGLFHVLNDGQLRTTSPSRDRAVLGIVREVAELAYRGRDWLTVCHAGAVIDGDRCLLLPAASGSGKSTLAAALSCAGWNVISDDVVPIDRGTHEAVSVPIPFNLKPSSLPVLSQFDRQIGETRGFERGDQRIHYLVPSHFSEKPPAASHPVGQIVYTCYRPGAETSLRPLSRVESFERLIRSDCMLPLPLQDDLVEELVGWIGAVPAWELSYCSLREAREALSGLRGP
jgi:hypothetical protein